MVSIRGIKKRKKADNKDAQDASPSATPFDWWLQFSLRISDPAFCLFPVSSVKSGIICTLILSSEIIQACDKHAEEVLKEKIKTERGMNPSVLLGPLAQSKNIEKFESVFKISRRTFNYICSLVEEDMLARASNFVDLNGKRLSLNDQVAIALRRLSSGDSLSTIGDSFLMNQSTVSQVTWKFVEAMEERGLHHLSWPSTEMEIEEIKCKFQNIRGLSNCCGAVDSTHIMMTLPSVDALNSVWLDRDKNCSMVLQAIVDPDLRFRDIVTGWPGSMSDEHVLRSSSFFKLVEEGKRLNWVEKILPEGTVVREYIIGDTGFPLLPWLLTPYEGKELSNVQVEFNKRVVETQMVAKKALARLKEMWRIIQGVMWKPDKHKLPRIILVCCILHNIVIDMKDEVLDNMPSCHQHDSRYHDQTCEFADNTAKDMREKLSLYFSGKVPT